MPSTISRRRLLAATGAVGLAGASGCLDNISEATDGQNGERRLRLTLSGETASLRDRYVTDLEESRPDWDEEAFSAALDGETYTTQYREPFFARDDPTYAERDGTYYRLGSVVVGEEEVTHPVLRLKTVGRPDELDSVPDHVAHGDLPEADRRAVKIAQMAARARGNAGGVPWGLVQRGGYVYRSEEAVEASSLLGDSGPSHVKYRDGIYSVEVARETFYEQIYRAEVEPVAESPDEMEAVLRARFVGPRLDGDDLSADERSILREARSRDSYSETHPYSSAYRSILTRLERRAYVDGNVQKDSFAEPEKRDLLRYDGRYYDFRLRFLDGE